MAWEVVETKPLSEWDVVSVAPARDGPPTAPGEIPGSVAGTGNRPGEKPAAKRGVWESLRGMDEAALATLTGMTGGAVGMAAGTAEGIYKAIRDGKFGSPEGASDVERTASARAQQLTYAPRTEAGKEYTDTIGRGMQNLLPVAGLGAEVGALSRSAAPAKTAVADATKAGVSKVADAVTPSISPEMAKMSVLAEKFKIPIRPDMLIDNKLVKFAGEGAENVPLTLSKKTARNEAFTTALIKLIDPEAKAKRLTPDVFAILMDKAGKEIGDIAGKARVPFDEQLSKSLVAHLDDLATEVSEVRDVNTAWVKRITDAVDDKGVIKGEALRKLNTRIARQIKGTPDGDLRRTLSDVQEIMMDSLGKNLPEGDLVKFQEARKRYAYGKAVEPVVAKTIDGMFPPAQLMGRVTANAAGKRFMAIDKGGDLGDLAKVGQFIKEPASTNTAERNLVYRTLTDALAASKALAMSPAAAAYNTIGPGVASRMGKANQPAPTALPRPAPEPTLERGFEPRRPAQQPAQPLGDLTPDWQTTPGAGVERPGAIDAAGLYPAVGDNVTTTGNRRAKLDVPAVPGRPDLPDALVSGGPAETAATEAANAAMNDPGAIHARRVQEMDRLKANAGPEVTKVLDLQFNIFELEQAAAQATDEVIRAALLKRAQELRDGKAK